MLVIIETIPNPVDVRQGPLTSSGMVKMLRSLSEGQCITLLPNTEQDKDLERQRTHWSIAAKRAGIDVITRAAIVETGDRAIRIWRTDYP